MKNVKIFAATLIAVIGFTACTKDQGETLDTGKGSSELVLYFNQMTRAAEGNSADGTEPGEGAENDVAVIEFFTFNGDTPDGVTPYFRKETTSLSSTTFRVDAGMKKILVAVNANVFNGLIK